MNEKDKKFLEEVKKQIDGLNYYIQTMHVPDKDKEKLKHIKNTISDVSNKLDRNIYESNKQLRASSIEKIESDYRTSLSSINSPTKEMVKSSEINTSIRRSLLSGKINILKQASERLFKKASDENGKDDTQQP